MYTTLDTIVKNLILSKRMTIHWYVEFLVHGAAALRELTLDTLRVVNTQELTLDAGYSADLPCDYVDIVKMNLQIGQKFKPILSREDISPIRKYSVTGQIEPYSDATQPVPEGITSFAYNPLFGAYNWMDDIGEFTGGLYGVNSVDCDPFGYQIFLEENRVQFLENPTFDTFKPILQYISDGQSVSCASQVDVRATAAIQAYINWKRSPNADVDQSPEGKHWVNQRGILRARLSKLTTSKIRQIFNGNYYPGPKN